MITRATYQLLIKEAKEDSKFKRDLADVMRESCSKFAESVKAIGQSMTDLGAGISRSIELLSGAIMQQQQQQTNELNQNVFYQQHRYPSQSHAISNNGAYPQMLSVQQVQQPDTQNDQNTYYFK